MKPKTANSLTILIVGFLIAVACTESQTPKLSEKEAEAIAIDTYIYGYPLILMDQTRKVMTNVAQPDGLRAPMGQFAHAREFPTPAFQDVTTPNVDTLYSTAWVDLSKEPYILQVPDEKGRYYLMPFLVVGQRSLQIQEQGPQELQRAVLLSQDLAGKAFFQRRSRNTNLPPIWCGLSDGPIVTEHLKIMMPCTNFRTIIRSFL